MSRTIDLIIRSHDRDWIDQRRAASPSARPLFIVGMLRSGTTLAEQILASHPQICGAGELAFWGAEAPAAIGGATAPPDMNRVSDAAVAHLGAGYLILLLHSSADALRVVDKFPANFLFLGLIHAAFPRARIIHMRRNALDTCVSIYFQHFEAANA